MKKIQTFMLNHPYISIAFILPFTLFIVVGIFSILLNLVLPLIIALWLAGWVYTRIVDRPVKNYYQQPLWFVRY